MFLVTITNAFVPIERVYSVNTYMEGLGPKGEVASMITVFVLTSRDEKTFVIAAVCHCGRLSLRPFVIEAMRPLL